MRHDPNADASSHARESRVGGRVVRISCGNVQACPVRLWNGQARTTKTCGMRCPRGSSARRVRCDQAQPGLRGGRNAPRATGNEMSEGAEASAGSFARWKKRRAGGGCARKHRTPPPQGLSFRTGGRRAGEGGTSAQSLPWGVGDSHRGRGACMCVIHTQAPVTRSAAAHKAASYPLSHLVLVC